MNPRSLVPFLSYAATYVSIAMGLISSIVLARLLTPDEIGASSVSFALIAFANLFRDLGLANFIHTSKTLPDRTFRTCLGVSMAIGVTLFAIIAIASQLISATSNDVRISHATLALSFNFLLIPPQAILFAILVRKGMHARIFIGISSAAIFNLLFSWLFASHGYSYLSGPLASVISSALGLLVVFFLRDRSFGIRPHLEGARHVVSVSIHPFISGIAKTGTERAPELSLAGLGGGLDNVAYYEKAASATELGRRLVFDSIGQIFVPRFRAAIGDKERFNIIAGQYLSLSVILGMPVAIGLILSAEPLIAFLFGTKWQSTVPILKALACSIPLAFLVASISQIAFFEDLHSRLTRILLPSRLLEIMAIALAALNGVQWIAPTIVACEGFIALILLKLFSNHYDLRQFASGCMKGVCLSIIAVPGALYLSNHLSSPEHSNLLRIIAPASALALTWLVFAAPSFISWRNTRNKEPVSL